jgi:Tol biopolymer transport system component
MADLAVELDEIQIESGTGMRAAAVPVRARRRWGFIAATAVVLTVAAAVLWKLRGAEVTTAPALIPLTAFPGDEEEPALSPDGNQVAFSWDGERGNNRDIYLMPVGAGTPLRLTTHPAVERSPAWSPDGTMLAFARIESGVSTIYIATPPVPNSERRLAAVGPFAEGGWSPLLSWLPDGRRVVSLASDPATGMSGIVALGLDGGEPRRLVWSHSEPGYSYRFPAMSPTGHALAFALCPENFRCDVQILDLDANLSPTGPVRQVTSIHSNINGIAWTPDGGSLVVGSGGGYIFSLWRVALNGTPPTRVDLAGDHASHPSVSRRGGLLAYASDNANYDLWKFEGDRPRETLAASTRYESDPQFSPDGKRVVFESNRLGPLRLWIANADGTSPRPAGEGGESQGSPRWSPDGRSIAYDALRPDGSHAIFVIAADGGAGRFLCLGSLPAWSHDSSGVYFNHDARIWRIPAAGGTPTVVVPGGTNAIESPDGLVLYYRKPGARGVLFARPVAGGAERQVLTTMQSSIHQFFPADDGVFYVAVPDPNEPFSHEIRFFDFAHQQHKTLHRFQAKNGSGLSVSTDRKTILYSGTTPVDGYDLMLIRNFR